MTKPAPADKDDQAVGLSEAHEHHLPDITLAALRYARAIPGPVDKRGVELLYRVRDLKKWARNWPRAEPPTRTDSPARRRRRTAAEPGLSGSADTIPSSWRTPGSPGPAQKRKTAP